MNVVDYKDVIVSVEHLYLMTKLYGIEIEELDCLYNIYNDKEETLYITSGPKLMRVKLKP
mgnify:CR=1 FL=1